MISKVITGNNFYGCCKYVCSDASRVEILNVNGVRESEYRLMAFDFEENRKQRESKKKAVFHGILSFPKHENPDKSLLIEIAQKYLAQIGFENSPYVIAKHKDKEHCHLHLISSFVDLDGKAVNENWIGLNAKKVSQKLTDEYGLTPAIGKKLKDTNLDALSEKELAKYQIYECMTFELETSSDFQTLIQKLQKSNIEMHFKTKKNDENVIQGVSLKYGEYVFKGSEIDKLFSYLNIQKQLLANKNVLHEKESLKTQVKDKTKNNTNFLNM